MDNIVLAGLTHLERCWNLASNGVDREYILRELQRRGIPPEVAENMLENLRLAGILDALGLLLLMTARGDGILQRLADLGSPQVDELAPRLAQIAEKVDELVHELSQDQDVASKPGPLAKVLGKAFGKGGVAKRYSPKIESLMDSLEAVLWAIEEEARSILAKKLESMEAEARELLKAAKSGGYSEIASRLEAILGEIAELLESPIQTPADLETSLIKTQRIDSELKEIQTVLSKSKEVRAALTAELSKVRGEMESLRLKIDRLREVGIEPLYLEDSLRWIEARVARIERRCPPEDLECLEIALADLRAIEEKALANLAAESERLEKLSNELETTFAMIPEAERAADLLDEEFNTNAFTALMGALAVKLSSIRAGTKLRDPEDVDKVLEEVREIKENLELLIFIKRAEEKAGPLSEQLKLVSEGDAVLATVRAALQIPSAAPEERARKALAPLKEVKRKLSEYLEAVSDAEKFYPYWKEYILSRLESERELRLDSLEKIPERWRAWTAKRLTEEGLVRFVGDRIAAVKPPGEVKPPAPPKPKVEVAKPEAPPIPAPPPEVPAPPLEKVEAPPTPAEVKPPVPLERVPEVKIPEIAEPTALIDALAILVSELSKRTTSETIAELVSEIEAIKTQASQEKAEEVLSSLTAMGRKIARRIP